MIRILLLITTIMLGWINMPAQAYLSSGSQNLWPVLSEQFTMPVDTRKTDVQTQLNWDLRNPKYIHRLTVNARPYLYTVFQETKKLHLPAELALLPMIESNYVPDGDSRAGAVGLWQLMPGTAMDYGVKINYFYDGRKSTTVSTKVALHFLSYLYQMFNHNWLLALAAYDAGPGTVMEAMKYNRAHGRPTDFWALSLPKETEVYVPKLLALAAIIQHPHAYGIRLSPVPDKAVTSTVKINKQMKLTTIANLAHTSVNTVQKLNPALKRSVTPPHQSVTLVLPAGEKQTFVKRLAVHKAIQKEIAEKNLRSYTVKHGDSLSGIAVKFKTKTTVLQKINQLDNGLIRIGQALLVPRMISSVTEKNNSVVVKKTIAHNTSLSYTVKSGDNLGTIAHHLQVTRKQLELWNHLNPKTSLQIGEKLVLENKTTSSPKTKIVTVAKRIAPIPADENVKLDNEHLYIVKHGDNLHRLAAEFDTTTYHIIEHNHLKSADLQVGEHLLLPNA